MEIHNGPGHVRSQTYVVSAIACQMCPQGALSAVTPVFPAVHV